MIFYSCWPFADSVGFFARTVWPATIKSKLVGNERHRRNASLAAPVACLIGSNLAAAAFIVAFDSLVFSISRESSDR